MIINHNLPAMNAQRNMAANQAAQSKNTEKLSTGLRINRAGDDAAGLAISEKMRGQIRGLDQASRNSQDGISMIQTAEGALDQTHSILQRMRELSVQAANDTNTSADRSEIQKEVNQLTSEINRIGNTTEFNTQKLLNGDKSAKNGSTQGVWTITTAGTLSGLAQGAVIDINGMKFTKRVSGETNTKVGANSGEFYNAATLAAAINTSKLSVRFMAYVSGNQSTGQESVVIKQRVGYETASATALSGGIVMSVTGNTGGTTVTTATKVAGSSGVNTAAFFQVGANQFQSFEMSINDMRSVKLGISIASTAVGTSGVGTFFTSGLSASNGTSSTMTEHTLSVMSHSGAANAITRINFAIEQVSSERSKLGAYQNRLEYTINNLKTSSENLTASESRIRDTDMAKEMMSFTKNNILSQAAQSMLAQANQAPQGVLRLLG